MNPVTSIAQFARQVAVPRIGFLFPVLLIFDSATQTSATDSRELWVPTEHLEAVLEKMPRAVLLTPQQYEQLLSDFEKANRDKAATKAKPPVPATIRSAVIEGSVEPGSQVVVLTATYEVESFAEGWTEVPLLLPASHLGHVAINEQSAIRSGGKKPTTLLVSGRGVHTVVAEFHMPVDRAPGGNTISLPALGAPASVVLAFPEGAEVTSDLPFVRDEVTPGRAVFALPTARGSNHEIRWSAQKVASIPGAAILQTCSYVYRLEATNLHADLGLVINSTLADLPGRFTLNYPEEFRVLGVEGSELLRWKSEEPGVIETVLLPGDRVAVDFRILLERDLDTATEDGEIVVDLPVVTIPGIHRASGTFSLIGSDSVRVRTIETGPLDAPIPDDAEGSFSHLPNYIASFSFPLSETPPRVTLSPAGSEFRAQLDTLVDLRREHIEMARSIRVVPREGDLFHVDVTVPEVEEVVKATSEQPGFSWKEISANALRLAWENGILPGAFADVQLTTRRDSAGWYEMGEDPSELVFESAVIEGAEATSGYLAVSFDPSFSVETVTSDGLEIRDARTTPVSGALAWFRLEDFSLTLAANHRAPELEAAVTAYVLPLSNTLEIEGQLDLTIQHSGIEEVEIGLPPEVASLFRFESPLIAEQSLLPDDSGWLLRFHQEKRGGILIRFRAVLPILGEGEDGNAEEGPSRTFTSTLPSILIPAAKRMSGHWIIEANTDTELEFKANGLDPIDSLRVPVVDGYRPQHRILAGYRYRGGEGTLTLSGTRHEPADAVSTVVDNLRLDTVVSTDGSDRHRASLAVRSAGEQFLEIALPEDAVLWSLSLAGVPVKPVRSGSRALRVQLPANASGVTDLSIDVIYQTPGHEWGSAGKETLAPIELADQIPILQTEWVLHLPHGYDYQRIQSNLGQEFEVEDRLLLGAAGKKAGELVTLAGIASDLYFGTSFVDTSLLPERPGWTNHSPLSPSTEIPHPSIWSQLKEIDLSATDRDRAPQKVPPMLASVAEESVIPAETATSSIRSIEDKLKTIILPSVEFVDTPLRDALEFLQQRSVELDTSEPDPSRRGMNMILDVSTVFAPTESADADGFGFSQSSSTPSIGDTPINLRLTNVPLSEALRYTASLAQLKYKVEPHAVVIVPLSTPDQDLYTSVYTVPPTFLSNIESDNEVAADPFADPADAGGGGAAIARRMTAKGILESAGITFGPGASAIYSPETGQLIVRNTQDQMELVEAYQESLRSGPAPSIEGGMRVESTLDPANSQFLTSSAIRGLDIGDAGRRPIAFDLPESGLSYRFSGLHAPEPIQFRFVDWGRQIRIAWVWIAVGGCLFWFGARRWLQRPVFAGLTGVLILTFLPLVVSRSLTEFCNALLLGWIVALALALIAKRFGKEVAHEA